MPLLIEKYGLERAAAAQAEEEGVDWSTLTPREKEQYYNKVRSPKSPVKSGKDENGNIPATDMFRRMGR